MQRTRTNRKTRNLDEDGEPKMRNKFTKEEDDKLIELVKQFGESAWPELSKQMEGRSTRQCRDRWTQYLSPAANNSSWNHDEDTRLMKLYHELGPRWAIISKYFNGRTNSCVRNRAVYLIRNINKTYTATKKTNPKPIQQQEEMSSPSTSPGNSRPPEVEMVPLQPKIVQIAQIPVPKIIEHVNVPIPQQPQPEPPVNKPAPKKLDKESWKDNLPFQISTCNYLILPVSNFRDFDFETSIYQ